MDAAYVQVFTEEDVAEFASDDCPQTCKGECAARGQFHERAEAQLILQVGFLACLGAGKLLGEEPSAFGAEFIVLGGEIAAYGACFFG